MPTPITLRNIGIPDFGSANNLFLQSSGQITDALSGFAQRATNEQARLNQEDAANRARGLEDLLVSFTDTTALADYSDVGSLQRDFRTAARDQGYRPSEFNALTSNLADAFNQAGALTPQDQLRLSQQESLLNQQLVSNQNIYDQRVNELATRLGVNSSLLDADIPLADAASNISKLVDNPAAVLSLQGAIQRIGEQVTGRPYAVTGNLLQHFAGTGIEEGWIFDDSLDGGSIDTQVGKEIADTIQKLESTDARTINDLKRRKQLLDLEANNAIASQLQAAREALASNQRNTYVGRNQSVPVPSDFNALNSIYASANIGLNNLLTPTQLSQRNTPPPSVGTFNAQINSDLVEEEAEAQDALSRAIRLRR